MECLENWRTSSISIKKHNTKASRILHEIKSKEKHAELLQLKYGIGCASANRMCGRGTILFATVAKKCRSGHSLPPYDCAPTRLLVRLFKDW